MTILGHRLHAGSLAWAVHRVTGIALSLYMFAHIYVLSRLGDREDFAALMGMMENPFVKAGEVVLLMAVAAHALNGIRLSMVDLGAPTKAQKPMFLLASIVWAGTFFYGAYAIFGGAH